MIKIAHLYYDLMNLYGEAGNVMALKKHIEINNEKCSIHFLTINDKIDFTKYDIFYMGTGIADNQLLVLNDLKKYKKDIIKAIDDNKYFIFTGNSLELLGNKIIELNKMEHPCLGIFDFTTQEVDFRIVGEQIFKSNDYKEKVIGFQNRNTKADINDNNLFEVIEGTSSNLSNKLEGIKYKNLIATYLLGPLLIRNPFITDKLVKDLLGPKYCQKTIKQEYLAYEEYLKNVVQIKKD